MTTFHTYIEELEPLATQLNKCSLKGTTAILKELPPKPSIRTWEAYQLLSRAVAKYHYDTDLCDRLTKLQVNFYNTSNLNDATSDLISKHMNAVDERRKKQAEEAALRKLEEKKNEEKLAQQKLMERHGVSF